MAGNDKKVYPLTTLMPSSSKIVVSQPQTQLQSSGTCKPQSYKIFVVPPSQLNSLGLIAKNENGKIILSQKSPNTSSVSNVLSSSSCSPVTRNATSLSNVETTTLKITSSSQGTNLQGGSQLGKACSVVGSSPGTSTRPLYVRRSTNRRLLPQFTKHWKSSLDEVGYIRCPLRGCNYISLAFGEMSVHYYQCKGEPYPTKFLCTACNGRVKSEEDLRNHLVVTHSIDGKIAKKQKKPQVVVPKQEEKAKVWIRKRAYSKVHKISWNISLDEKGYVNCFFKNCHFMALNLEQMIQHYGICNGTPSANAVACPYCEGCAESREKLQAHTLKSHSDSATIQLVTKETPAAKKVLPLSVSPSSVRVSTASQYINVADVSQPVVVHRNVRYNQPQPSGAGTAHRTLHALKAERVPMLVPAPAAMMRSQPAYIQTVAVSHSQPVYTQTVSVSHSQPVYTQAVAVATNREQDVPEPQVHCLFSMYDEEEDPLEDSSAQIPSSSTVLCVEETEHDSSAVSCKTYSKTSPKPSRDVEIIHTSDDDVITCTLTENVYTKDYDIEVIEEPSSEGGSNLIVKANPDELGMQRLQDYVTHCDNSSEERKQDTMYQVEESEERPLICSSEFGVHKEQVTEEVEAIQDAEIMSTSILPNQTPETVTIFSNDMEEVGKETCVTYSEENSQSASASAAPRNQSPQNYALFTDYNECEYPQEYPLESSNVSVGNLDSNCTIEEPSKIQVTTEENLLGRARGDNTSVSYNSSVEEYIIPDMWEPSVNYISTSLSECSLKNKPECSGKKTAEFESKSVESKENIATIPISDSLHPELNFNEQGERETMMGMHLQENLQGNITQISPEGRITNYLAEVTQSSDSILPDVSPDTDTKLAVQAQIQSEKMHREVYEKSLQSSQYSVTSDLPSLGSEVGVGLAAPNEEMGTSSQLAPFPGVIEMHMAEQDSISEPAQENTYVISVAGEVLPEKIAMVGEDCNREQSMSFSVSAFSSTVSSENQLCEMHGITFNTDQSIGDDSPGKVPETGATSDRLDVDIDQSIGESSSWKATETGATSNTLDVQVGLVESEQYSAKENDVKPDSQPAYTADPVNEYSELKSAPDKKCEIEMLKEEKKDATYHGLTDQVELPTDVHPQTEVDKSPCQLSELQTINEENQIFAPCSEEVLEKVPSLHLVQSSGDQVEPIERKMKLAACDVLEVPSSGEVEQTTDFPKIVSRVHCQEENEVENNIGSCLAENEAGERNDVTNKCMKESEKQEGTIVCVQSPYRLGDQTSEIADVLKPVGIGVVSSDSKEPDDISNESIPVEEAVECITRLSLIDSSLPSNRETDSPHLPSEINEEKGLVNTNTESLLGDGVPSNEPEAVPQKTGLDPLEKSSLPIVVDSEICIKENEQNIPEKVTSAGEMGGEKSNEADNIVDCYSSCSKVEEKVDEEKMAESPAIEEEKSIPLHTPCVEVLPLKEAELSGSPPEKTENAAMLVVKTEAENGCSGEPRSVDLQQVGSVSPSRDTSLLEQEAMNQQSVGVQEGIDQRTEEAVPELLQPCEIKIMIDPKPQENTPDDTPQRGKASTQNNDEDYDQGFSRLRQLAEECASTKELLVNEKQPSIEKATESIQEIPDTSQTIQFVHQPKEIEDQTVSEKNLKELNKEALTLISSDITETDIHEHSILGKDFKKCNEEESFEKSQDLTQYSGTVVDETMSGKDVEKLSEEESVEESLSFNEVSDVLHTAAVQTMTGKDVKKFIEMDSIEKSLVLTETTDTDVDEPTTSGKDMPKFIEQESAEESPVSYQCSSMDVEESKAVEQEEVLNSPKPDTGSEAGNEHTDQTIASEVSGAITSQQGLAESPSTPLPSNDVEVKVGTPNTTLKNDTLLPKVEVSEELPVDEPMESSAQRHVERAPSVESEVNPEKNIKVEEVKDLSTSNTSDTILLSKQIFCSNLDLSYNLGPPLKKRHCMGKQPVLVTKSGSVETSIKGYVLGKRKREEISDVEVGASEASESTEKVESDTLKVQPHVQEKNEYPNLSHLPHSSEATKENQERNRSEPVENPTLEEHVNGAPERCEDEKEPVKAVAMLEGSKEEIVKECELIADTNSKHTVAKQQRKRKGIKEEDESMQKECKEAVAEAVDEVSHISETASSTRKIRKVEVKKEQPTEIKYKLRSSLQGDDGSSNSSIGSECELGKRRRSKRNLRTQANVESESSVETTQQEILKPGIKTESQTVFESQIEVKEECSDEENLSKSTAKYNIRKCKNFEGLKEYLGLESETHITQDVPVIKHEQTEVVPFDSESSLMSEDSALSKASSETEFRSNSSLDMIDDSACSTVDSIIGDDDNAVDGDITSKSTNRKPRGKSRSKRGRRKGASGQRSVSKDSEKSTEHGSEAEGTEQVELPSTPVEVQCAKCSDKMLQKAFYAHNMTKHNGLSWIEGEEPLDMQNEKLITGIFWRVLKNHRKTLTCEDCGVSKKSAVGFLSHISSCKRTAEEREALKVKCDICDRYMLPTSLKVHLSFHRSMEAKKQKAPEPTILNEPRSKRAAAERATSLMQEFIKDEAEGRADDVSKKHEADKNECLYSRTGPYKAHKIVIGKWRSTLAAEGVAACTFPGCTFKCSDLSTLIDHYRECKKAPKRRFRCEVCEFETKDEREIKLHVETTHIQGQEADDSDTEPSVAVRRFNYSLKVCNKLKFLAKESSGPVVGDKPYTPALKWTLSYLTENCNEPNLFPQYHTQESDWISVSNCDIEHYLPTTKESIPISSVAMKEKISNIDGVELEWKRLKLFHSEIIDGVPTLFTGGPIWALAWCPLPLQLMRYSDKLQQFLAVSCHRDMEDAFSSNETTVAKGLIQIWSFEDLDNETKSTVPPKLAFGIAHDYGAVWGLEWCLSGCYDIDQPKDEGEKVKRLGLLAAACSDGTVRVFSVCFPESLPKTDSEYRVYKPEPVMTLILDEKPSCKLGGLPWSCLRLSWYKGKHHKIIAGGFSNGMVALWNIASTSPLLSRQEGKTRVIYPYHTFQAHNCCVTALSLAPQDDGRYLMTGSTDMTVKVWDMEDATGPITPVYRKGMVTDGVWLTHWLSTVTSYDDVYNMGHSNATLNPPRSYGFKVYPLLAQNSVAWSLSSNDWMNAVAQSTHAGELTAIFPHQLILNVDTEKGMKDKRMVLSYVELKDFTEEGSGHVCSTVCTSPCSKKASPASAGNNTGDETNNLSSPIVESVETVDDTCGNNSGISFLIARNPRCGKTCVIIPFAGSEDIENLPAEDENAEEETEENKIPECLSVLDEYEMKLLLGFKKDLERLNVTSKLKITFPFHKNEKKRSNSNDTVQEYLMVVGPVEDKNKTEETSQSSEPASDAAGTSGTDLNFSKVIRFNPSRYEAVAKKFGMIFCYFPADDMGSMPVESRIWMRKSEGMRTAAVEMYPITSLNKVQWNPNCRSCLWLAGGYQCGVLRLTCVSGMHNYDTDKFLAQYNSTPGDLKCTV